MGRHALKPAFTVLGLCGLSGSGKSRIAVELAKAWNFSHIEVDELGHAALRAASTEIVAAFGPACLSGQGDIDRKYLGKLVFADPQALQKLESIVHPRMVQETRALVAKARQDWPALQGVIINAALLFHMGLHTLCDQIVIVRAPFLVRKRRIMQRDGLSEAAALQRLRTQTLLLPKDIRHCADIVKVENRKGRLALRCLVNMRGRETWNRIK